MEDFQIVELFLQREEEALSQTKTKYGKRLRSLAFGMVQDLQTAEECENDTYLQAWNAIPPHEPKTYLYPFLARITRHIALDHCRRNNTQKRSAQIIQLSTELEQCIPASGNTEFQMEQERVQAVLNDFLRGLKSIQRKVFLRRYWYLESIEEIAQYFGFTQSKVKSMLYRIRNKLRNNLEKEGLSI